MSNKSKKTKLSGPAVFMYGTIVLTAAIAATCFIIFYTDIYKNDVILWIGIVSFMILYHFGLRILMGNVTKLFNVDYNHALFKQRAFEKNLYKTLRLKKWKSKVLTFDPESFNLKHRTLEQIAITMAKSELDHWINEIISVAAIFFAFLWGGWPAFVISSVAAMFFDAQFILVQRYNRPVMLKLIKRKTVLSYKKTASLQTV